jgi:hypothetical protein
MPPAGVRVWLETLRTLHQVLVRASGNAWHVQVG